MISKQQLVVVIWIAIVTISVQFVPTTALAHGGHGHIPNLVTAVPHDRTEGGAFQLKAEHTGTVAQAKTADFTRPATAGSCSNGCCASGFSCCVPAILPEPIHRLPVRLKARKLERPGPSIRAGIDPEALPRPPKSFT
jgi:hypothetical protein